MGASNTGPAGAGRAHRGCFAEPGLGSAGCGQSGPGRMGIARLARGRGAVDVSLVGCATRSGAGMGTARDCTGCTAGPHVPFMGCAATASPGGRRADMGLARSGCAACLCASTVMGRARCAPCSAAGSGNVRPGMGSTRRTRTGRSIVEPARRGSDCAVGAVMESAGRAIVGRRGRPSNPGCPAARAAGASSRRRRLGCPRGTRAATDSCSLMGSAWKSVDIQSPSGLERAGRSGGMGHSEDRRAGCAARAVLGSAGGDGSCATGA